MLVLELLLLRTKPCCLPLLFGFDTLLGLRSFLVTLLALPEIHLDHEVLILFALLCCLFELDLLSVGCGHLLK